MLKIGLIIFFMLLLQGILTFFQVKNYRKNVSEIHKKGSLFVGQTKGRIKAGSIVLMAIDPDGIILDARSMTGITVFHRFKSIEEIQGKNIYQSEDWLGQMKNKQMAKAIKKGTEAMHNNLKNDEDINGN